MTVNKKKNQDMLPTTLWPLDRLSLFMSIVRNFHNIVNLPPMRRRDDGATAHGIIKKDIIQALNPMLCAHDGTSSSSLQRTRMQTQCALTMDSTPSEIPIHQHLALSSDVMVRDIHCLCDFKRRRRKSWNFSISLFLVADFPLLLLSRLLQKNDEFSYEHE